MGGRGELEDSTGDKNFCRVEVSAIRGLPSKRERNDGSCVCLLLTVLEEYQPPFTVAQRPRILPRGRVCDPVSPVPFSVIINEIQADATLQIRNGLSRSISLFVSM